MNSLIKCSNFVQFSDLSSISLGQEDKLFYKDLYNHYNKSIPDELALAAHDKMLRYYFENYHQSQYKNRIILAYDNAQYNSKFVSISRYLEQKFKIEEPIIDICCQGQNSYFIAIKMATIFSRSLDGKTFVLLLSSLPKDNGLYGAQINASILNIVIEPCSANVQDGISIVHSHSDTVCDEIEIAYSLDAYLDIQKNIIDQQEKVLVYCNFGIKQCGLNNNNVVEYENLSLMLYKLMKKRCWSTKCSLMIYYEQSSRSLSFVLLRKN